MELSNYIIYKKYKENKESNIQNDEENEKIVNMICEMAYDSEAKELDKKIIINAINRLINNPSFGLFFLILDKNLNQLCGMNLITYEYKISDDSVNVWIQTVFVSREYRTKGLFKKLISENEKHVKESGKFNNMLKLYMDKDNYVAEQVYFKVGFVVTNEILYGIDYFHDSIDFLMYDQNSQLNLNTNGGKFTIQILSHINIILNTKDKNFTSIQRNVTVNIDDIIPSIEKVVNNDNLGKIVYIFDEIDKIICGLFFVFYEFSDWRNSIFWWVNDFMINENYRKFIESNMNSIIYSLVKLNYDSKSCGLRYIVQENNEHLINTTVLLKSNYIIYEKNLEK